MSTVFWDKKWKQPFEDAIRELKNDLLIISPFIQKGITEELLPRTKIGIRVITRFNLRDFYSGVSDIEALEMLLVRNAQIKGVRNLHAKVYIFDHARAFVTSANLTETALTRNHEFGVTTDNADLVASAVKYFEELWRRAGESLTKQRIAEWERTLWGVPRKASGSDESRLPDWGTDLGVETDNSIIDAPCSYENAQQYFVKFFGEATERASLTRPVLEQVESSGCHWACTYPRGKRPRQVRDGAIMFMARLVDGGDIQVFGRAIGRSHHDGQDDATKQDIALRDWKAKWPHYIRVRGAEFIGGTLENGISLSELMKKFGANAFASTARNLAAGAGNTNPHHAYRQQAAVELTGSAARWLNKRIDAAMATHGRIPAESLNFP